MLARAVVLLMLGAIACAQVPQDFPETMACKQNDGSTATITEAEILADVVGPKGVLSDKSAANVASGKCSGLSGIPLYTNSVAGKASVGFAYDEAKKTYYYCFAQGAVDVATGYPTQCTEETSQDS
ncbi:hypothetical protein CCHL11_07984 [Colletotrichum chlorophyti]|uniref:Uncharacterized protein n=1 Tax=Colletotrichum chlorophyti TaxID=708187 RepID=A0A1Q8RM30_9PEZI|nr:hypothetical protein CCHL11_07984 [Colletotrichum chlorophyti]